MRLLFPFNIHRMVVCNLLESVPGGFSKYTIKQLISNGCQGRYLNESGCSEFLSDLSASICGKGFSPTMNFLPFRNCCETSIARYDKLTAIIDITEKCFCDNIYM